MCCSSLPVVLKWRCAHGAGLLCSSTMPMHLPMSMFWRLEQHALLVKAGAGLPVAILDPIARPAHGPGRARGAHAQQQLLVHAHRAQCAAMCARSHARAAAQQRSAPARRATVSRPSISSFMTSSAMARRALTLYADPGGSQHRVVQHHEQQLGQREHGRG